jgi:hypothetical protein
MKTFTLNELRRDHALWNSLHIIELPSGAFTLESRTHRETEPFATREEAQAVLQAEPHFGGLVDAKVEVHHLVEPEVDEMGNTSLRNVGPEFCIGGYVVSRLERDFATRDEADAVLSDAAYAFAKALTHDFHNKSALPVVKVVDVEGGTIVIRESSMLGFLYTLTDSSGNEQMTSTTPQLLCFPEAPAPVDQGTK